MKVYVCIGQIKNLKTGKVTNEVLGVYSTEEGCELCLADASDYVRDNMPDCDFHGIWALTDFDKAIAL